MKTDKFSLEEILLQNGYVYSGSCNCDGYETHNWKNTELRLEIKWRKYKGQVLILRGRKVIEMWFPVQDFSTKINLAHEMVNKIIEQEQKA